MSKESTKAALDKFFAKAAKQATPKAPRKNQKPEFTLTLTPCLLWMRESGWSVDVVEAKGVYNAQAGRYLDGQTEAGMSDIVGCTPQGIGAFVEAKAPGKLSTLRPAQREFLIDKIRCGAFAVVVDSVDRLNRLYRKWWSMSGRTESIQFLMSELPALPKRYQETVDPELGF